VARLKTWLLRIIIALIVVAFAFMGLRGLMIHLWRTPDLPQTFVVQGADGRAMAIVLMPSNYVYFSYNELVPYYTEMVLTRTTGEFGTHYLWNVWSVDKNAGWFGIRVLNDGQRPANIEVTVIEKFVDADPEVALPRDYFPRKGESIRSSILISDQTLEFEGSTLQRMPNDPEFLVVLEERLPFPEGPAR
jgi:hypothetical protein